MPGMFSPPLWYSNPNMHHGTCITHVPWCMPGSLTGGFLWSRWREKRSQHPRHMQNPRFCVSGKRPMYGPINPSLWVYVSLRLAELIHWNVKNFCFFLSMIIQHWDGQVIILLPSGKQGLSYQYLSQYQTLAKLESNSGLIMVRGLNTVLTEYSSFSIRSIYIISHSNVEEI